MKIPTICINNASLKYAGETLFSQLNLDLPAGKWTGLIGPSGIGKSSLLRMIVGLHNEKENNNTIFADNHIPVHEQTAYMAQHDLLLPWLTVLDNSLLGFKLRTRSKTACRLARDKAQTLLNEVGLKHAAHLYPHQLSGGMRQRTALVRTLMEEKPVVLMDEPFSALDTITRYKMQTLAAKLLQNKTVLFITHDPLEALRLAHNVYIMQGKPAYLKLVAQLNSDIPRAFAAPELVTLQTELFHELSKADGEAACD